jgi:hypothetical protein
MHCCSGYFSIEKLRVIDFLKTSDKLFFFAYMPYAANVFSVLAKIILKTEDTQEI